MSPEDCRPSFVDGTCAFCKEHSGEGQSQGLAPLFNDYNCIAPEEVEELENHMYLLCPPRVKAFVFKTRMWGGSFPGPAGEAFFD